MFQILIDQQIDRIADLYHYMKIKVYARIGNQSQATFASLDKNIISPLENEWKYIKTEKVGRNRWIHLTEEGNWASEFLI